MPRASQRERILHLLQAHEGEWIPAISLIDISLRYGARIHELRQMGHEIEIKERHNKRQRITAYRIVRASTATPEPLDALLESWHARLTSVPATTEETCET